VKFVLNSEIMKHYFGGERKRWREQEEMEGAKTKST